MGSQAKHSTDHELGYSPEQQVNSLRTRGLAPLLRAKGSLPGSAPVPESLPKPSLLPARRGGSESLPSRCKCWCYSGHWCGSDHFPPSLLGFPQVILFIKQILQTKGQSTSEQLRAQGAAAPRSSSAPCLPPVLKSFGPLCSQSLASQFSCLSPCRSFSFLSTVPCAFAPRPLLGDIHQQDSEKRQQLSASCDLNLFSLHWPVPLWPMCCSPALSSLGLAQRAHLSSQKVFFQGSASMMHTAPR